MVRISQVTFALLAFLWSSQAMALDSYRYMHVTIDTPWLIFVFLFFLVFAPMILSAILYIRNALNRDKEQHSDDESGVEARHD